MTTSQDVRPLPTALTALLELAVNRWLEASEAPALARLAGHSIAVEVRPPGLGLVFLSAADRLQLLGNLEGEEPGVTLSGSPVALAAALSGGDRSGISVQGDGAVLTDLQRALAGVSFDWAGWLESLTGAGSAGPLLRGGEALRGHVRRFMRRGLEDTVDYAREEARWLPPSGEFEAWTEDLAELRDATARLEARIARLEAHSSAGAPGASASADGPGWPGSG
ncbi:SCP2 domain-containing protein [Thioalkalivibrio sp.]|uniref:ubiquinone biosynthesis accessory factor UbiJ n=1 Tax=Thioalkalivibrio sp. TaxID=2093813 RepID=UPI00397693FF